MTRISSLPLILDQGLPREAASLLRARGCDCIHVGEIGMSQASDEEIIACALVRRATLITLDADFHAILAVSRAAAPSVVRVRVEGLNALAVVEIIETVIIDFADELSRGSLIAVKARKITCHLLPIGGVD